MRTLFSIIFLFCATTTVLEVYSTIGQAMPIDDVEYLVLRDRAIERAERVRNKYEGRSPAIGSNHESNQYNNH